MEISEEYKKFLNWCEGKWTQEHKMQKLLSKLSNDDIDFLKEQYENRLKADMVAMLTEIQLDIEEQEMAIHTDKDVWNNAIEVCSEVIQEKINQLKAESVVEDGND